MELSKNNYITTIKQVISKTMPQTTLFPSPITEEKFFQKLCAMKFVEAVYLFGSRARGDERKYSDYDLAIDCPNATLGEWQDIGELLDEAAFLDKIEYVRYDTLKDGLFKQQIDKYKKPLYVKTR